MSGAWGGPPGGADASPGRRDAIAASLIVHAIAVVGLVALMLGLSALLGPRRRRGPETPPYESGVPSIGPTGGRFGVRFYLVAAMFVIFDLEAVFLFAWALVATDLGWLAFAEAAVFTGVLLAGLWYLVRGGAFDLVPPREREVRQ